MCSSSRKPYTYTRESSPWNHRFLLCLWASQVIVTLGTVIFGGICYPFKDRDYRQDDGISNALYQVTLFLMSGIALGNLGFLTVQYLWYRENKLHPGWMLFIACWQLPFLLANASLCFWNFAEWAPKWQIYEVVELMYIFAVIPFAVHLWYASVVYHRMKKNRRRSADVELQNPEVN